MYLNLAANAINDDFVRDITERFKDPDYLSELWQLDLSRNTITQDAVERLREVLRQQRRDMRIIADDITGDSMHIKG